MKTGDEISVNTVFCLLVIMIFGLSHEVHAADDVPVMTHGMSIGSITQTSVVIWSRADRKSYLHARIVAGSGATADERYVTTTAQAGDDYTARLVISDLKPGTSYQYDLWFNYTENPLNAESSTDKVSGEFHTLPTTDVAQKIRFAWGGDLAGQNVCRDEKQGYPIFRVINRQPYDFFIGLGDMIYADALCKETGLYGNRQIPGQFTQSADIENFRAHWRYSREDPDFRSTLAKFPYYTIWDDHEVVNDFGPATDIRDTPPYTSGVRLMPMGLKSYLDYNPVVPVVPGSQKLYRNLAMGRNVELFFLDNRQYRDPNTAPDSTDNGKTMLGREQLQWLIESLTASTSTWKVIVSSVPISVPTGAPGRDGWANFDQDTGFESELWTLLKALQEKSVKNLIFITTDIHFASGFRYRPFPEYPDFEFYEFITGPLNAGAFRREEFDESFNPERLYLYGSATIKTFDDAVRWFNYGEIAVSETGELTLKVINGLGEVVYEMDL